MEEERVAMMALHLLSGVGDVLLKQLVSYCGSATDVFRQSSHRLDQIPGIGPGTTKAIRKGQTFEEARRILEKAAKEETAVYFYTDKNYPQRLRLIEDAPAVLFVKGNINLNHKKTVGIVGTREATAYGRDQVEKIVEELLPHQPLILSGLAYGIDIHAHKMALKHNLMTAAVMGSGIDVIYPSVHAETARKMMNQGGLITENLFGAKPDAHNFPARNRVIAGMCDALIVVEAAQKGGALITAEIANTYNKDVFAVPGNLGQKYSEGTNWLIKTHKAHLLTGIKDLEYIMRWDNQAETAPSQLSLELALASPEELNILRVLKDGSGQQPFDEIVFRSGYSHGMTASLLLSLELKNMVQTLPGKQFRLRGHIG